MRFLLLFFFIYSTLFGAKILSYNIYDRTDRADVMITFDTPYKGVIKQSITKNKIIIKLGDASIESAKIKKIASRYLHSLTITPMAHQTQIVATVPNGVHFIASKTADAYGLRLRFTTKKTAKKQHTTTQHSTQEFTTNLPTKKENNLSTSYYIVVGILIVGIIILFVLRKKIVAKNTNMQKETNSQWLFAQNKHSQETQEPTKPTQVQNMGENPISIRFQKIINDNASVVMLDFENTSYLIFIGGNNSFLLDKFVENKPQTQDDFETILQNRHQELDEFLQVEDTQTSTKFINKQEAFQAYTQKAGAISSYEE